MVAATGNYPFTIDDLRRAGPPDWRWVVAAPVPDVSVDVVVVGASDYDTAFLLDALPHGHADTRVLPPDGLLELMLFGNDWWAERPRKGETSRLERAVAVQDGIRVAKYLVEEWKGLTFTWPITSSSASAGEPTWDARLNEISALHERGYQIEGRTDEQRWSALERCVAELDLQTTAYFIAYLIRTRNGRVRDEVLAAWKSDLAKLREKFYVGGLNFEWPTP
ncbi:MAG: hypothetical protein ACRDF0_04730 [Candidatus Limnocylindria bacterium]